MLQNLQIDLALAREFLELKQKLAPMEERLEELKASLRPFGAGEYPVADIGVVKISHPGIAKRTGTKLVADETKITEVDADVFSTVLKAGLLVYEPVFSRNTASKVEARFG